MSKTGLFGWLFSSGRQVVEERVQPVGVQPIWHSAWTGTRHVNTLLAENLATVSACVGAISSVLASLPPIVYRTTDRGRTELTGHPVARMLRQPWGALTWVDWCEWLMSSVLLQGNALCEIISDGAGRVTALRPLPWQFVAPIVLPSGRLAFDVQVWPEPRRRLLMDEVFFLKDRTDNGYIGRSRISRSPDVIGNASSLQEYSAHSWRNGATPSGAIEIPQSLTNDQADRIRTRASRLAIPAHRTQAGS